MIFNINIPKPETFDEYQMFLDNLIGAAEQDLGVVEGEGGIKHDVGKDSLKNFKL